MEKNEKIQAKQQRAAKLIFGSVVLIGSIVLLYSLLNMEEDTAGATATAVTLGMRAASSKAATTTTTAENSNNNNNAGAAAGGANLRVHEKIHDPAVEEMMAQKVKDLDQTVRQIKKNLPKGKFMETDPGALKATGALQDATRDLLHYRYGKLEPYRVQVDLTFQKSNPTYEPNDHTDTFTIELAPSALQPHSIFTFLEIARQYKGGAFHRRAGHVLQAMVKGNVVKHLAFQEYNPKFPHKKGTVGYAGRPSGPGFYVSIQDNTRAHGPGSQQQANPNEADSCFGKVIKGYDDVIIERVKQMPGQGFLKPELHVIMDKMTILVPDPANPKRYVPWPTAARE